MPAWLATLLAPALATGVASIFGGTKSKQSASSTTDPFYALMSPFGIGQILQRMGALQGAGFPSGMMNNPMLSGMTGDIWKTIGQAWPDILKQAGTKSIIDSSQLKAPGSRR